MNYYIIIRGAAGAGKTTIAKRLAKIYNAHYISFDKVKNEAGFDNSEKGKLAANKLVLEEAKKHLSKGEIVIIDEVFYYPSQLTEMIEELPYKEYIFTLKAPVEACIARNVKRRVAKYRKMKDKDVKIVHKLASKLEHGIDINTHNKTIKDTVEEICSYLPEKE